MKVFYEIISEKKPSAVALGFFDGIHSGHREVLTPTAKEKSNGLIPVCLTFSKSPKEILSGGSFRTVMTREDKIRVLGELGIEHVCFADFNGIRELSAREFFDKILIEKLKAKKLFCGFNYRFGRNAEGDTEALKTFCAEAGIALTVVSPRLEGGEVVSSSRIKRLLHEGKIKEANKLLCGSFGFCGVITHGRALGRELGTPTLNMMPPEGMELPKYGVYASVVTLEDGGVYCGVTNVGIKPTVGGTVPLWETWMPDYHGGEIYGQPADVRLIEFLRPERKFDSLDELKSEIIKNGAQAREIFSLRREL